MQSELLNCRSHKEWGAFIGSIINKILNERSLQQAGREQLFLDMHSEGWVGILKAAKSFDPTKGVKFETFAYIYVYGYIRNFLKREFLQKRGINGMSRNNWDTEFENVKMIEDESLELQSVSCQEIINSNFTDSKTKLIMADFFIKNKNYRQIGIDHGVSHEWARKIVERGCHKLKEKYGKNENNIIN